MAAAIDPFDLGVALGATPPTTPNGTATTPAEQADFRAQRIALQAVFNANAPVVANVAPAVPAPPVPQVAPPVPQQQAAVAPVPPIQPRAGGISMVRNELVPWVGGGYTPATTILQPFSVLAFRSSDLSLALKVEKECMVGLTETRRLMPLGAVDTKDASSSVTLNQWIRTLAHALKERGLDSVFRANIDGTEVFLLEKWGKATKVNVDAHVTYLLAHGDEYDHKNLKLSAKYLLNSLDNDMLKRTEQELGNTLTQEATGPDVYAAVIALHSVLNDSTERFYISKLSKHKLVDEPGENVGTFADKVVSIAHHNEGISEHRVSDLHTLVYQCFDGASTTTFASAVSNLLAKCFQNDATVRDWESNVTMLKQMYRDLVTRSLWSALKHTKEKVEAQGLRASSEVKSLKAELKRLTKIVSGNAGSSSTTSRSTAVPTCYWCGEKGHTKPSCPNTDKPQKYVSQRANSTPATASAPPSTSRAKIPPKSGEPHTKTVSGTQFKWCDTCKKWNSGDKAHVTSEHVKGKNVPQASANLAQAESLGPTLSYVAGYTAAISDTRFVPPSPVPPCFNVQLTKDMHFTSDGHGRLIIEDDAGCRKDAPGATLCRICCQYSADPHHEDTEVHLQNSYFAFKFLEENNLIRTEEEQEPSPIAFVAGFVGSIASTTNPPVEEEEIEQIVDDTPLAEPVYCQLCKVHTTCSWHEQSNDHWQCWLLESMRTYFAEHVIYTTEPPIVATTDASASEEGEPWVLVERNKKKKKVLKGKTGQRQSKRC
jgi:hypothetical protein